MPCYRFAQLTVAYTPRYELLRARSAPYLVPDAPADVTMTVSDRALSRMRATYPSLNADWCEYLYCGSLFYRRLLPFDGVMLHASAVSVDGRAYLFSAPPGTGKSTHAASWLSLFGDRAVIVNDDKPALRFIDGTLYACGTPFTGKTPLGANVCVPVQGVCILSRGEDRIERIVAQQALPYLFDQTIHRLDRPMMERMLTTLERVLTAVPVWRLHCGIGEQAARLAYEAMSGRKAP